MSSRIYSLLLLALCLSACSIKDGEGNAGEEADKGSDAVAAPGVPKTVPCALAGAKAFEQDCAVDRFRRDGNSYVTVRHPDGGFRRLLELDGGKRYAAADGADPVEMNANGAEIEVTVGDDHYLFPNPAPANAAQP